MDGKGRWRDNVYIERFWRSIKYECIFLKEYSTLPALENGLQRWIKRYNTWRPHQALKNKTPQEFYQEGLCNIAPKILVAPLQVVEASSLRSENRSNLALHTQNLELTSLSTPSTIPNQYWNLILLNPLLHQAYFNQLLVEDWGPLLKARNPAMDNTNLEMNTLMRCWKNLG